MLVSPTEPRQIQALGQLSSVPERYGVDVMWMGKGLKWGVQRKEFPGDFISSLHDGRLGKELQQARELSGGAMVVLEGYGTWTDEGELVYRGRLTRAQLYGLTWTVFMEYQTPVIQVRNMTETIEAITSLQSWSRKAGHRSLGTRPGPDRSKWGTRDSRDWALHLIQGFEGIGPTVAGAIYDHFGGVPFRWNVDGPEELMKVPGVGEKRAMALWRALEVE